MTRSDARRAKAIEEKNRQKLDREVISLTLDYGSAQALYFHGPVIVTDLAVAEIQRQALQVAGEPIPDPVRCRFLIDTGADGSVVKHEFAEKAGLKLISENHPLKGIGIDATGRSYIGRVLFHTESKLVPGATHSTYIDTQIMSADLRSDHIDGLIGRDVLAHFLFSYDGKTGQVKLRYHRDLLQAVR